MFSIPRPSSSSRPLMTRLAALLVAPLATPSAPLVAMTQRATVSFLALAIMVAALSIAPQEAQATKPGKGQKPAVKKELQLSTNPVLLMDVKTGKVLYHRNANQKWYPASLTKLMTAYVAFRALDAGEITPDTVLTISQHALSYPPSKMGFKVGTRLTVDNALKMVVVKSANDIAAALAERIAGSEAAFAHRMNQEAARLGMRSTHFVNANGLYHKSQTSSARDMAILARHILVEFPQYRPLFGIPAIRHGKRVLRSYNRLLERFRGTDGMKTGFVCASGYNIVASATRRGRQLIAVVLGAPSSQIRSETAAFLLSEGFSRADMGSGRGIPITDSAQFGRRTEPDNMRPEVCTKGAQPRWIPPEELKVSYLGPHFKRMEPVRVYAGIARRNSRVSLPLQLALLPAKCPTH